MRVSPQQLYTIEREFSANSVCRDFRYRLKKAAGGLIGLRCFDLFRLPGSRKWLSGRAVERVVARPDY